MDQQTFDLHALKGGLSLKDANTRMKKPCAPQGIGRGKS
jgi:hypothetical protein